MARPVQDIRHQFSQPVRQVTVILFVLVVLGVSIGYFALPRVLPVFLANPYLNGFIAFVFVIGILACFWQIFQLIKSVRWLQRFADETVEPGAAPQLLAPLATLLRARGARMQISASSSRSILDSVATRIDEVRDITRYIVNLLIFLGLLGTFYGLATTVPGVVDTIRGLAPRAGESSLEVFNRLMAGLETQMNGMGVAFASSLLGLAGSLVVGLIELFVGHGQNRFYRELEEWLGSITRVSFASGEDGAAESSDAGAFAGVAEHFAEQVDRLELAFLNSDAGRQVVDAKLEKLADAVELLADKMARSGSSADTTDALTRVAEGQDRLIAHLETRGTGGDGIDAESRMRLRSIDVQMLRILEEVSAGRQESISELRADLHILTKAVQGERSDVRRLRAKSADPRLSTEG